MLYEVITLSLDVNSAAVFISQLDIKGTKIDTIDLNKKKCRFGNIIMFDSFSDSNLEIYHNTDSAETLIEKKGGFPGETVFFNFGKVPKGLYKALYFSDYGPIIRWVKN